MEAFRYGCIVGGEHFCKRSELSRQLAGYIRGGQNVVIQGERRMGKTSLVRETVAGMRGWRMVDADFMGVKSTTDICNRIADAMARFDCGDNVYRRAMSLLAHLRPVGQIDQMTGLPTISLDAKATATPASIPQALDALAAHVKGRKVCIVFDEFQDILDVKDGDQVLALMRSLIQLLPDICFVFLGSARNSMLSIFLSPNSPFYKGAAVFGVDEIPDDDFFRFAVGRFAIGRRKLPRDVFDRILEIACRTSGDVQELCDAVWQVTDPGRTLGSEDVERGVRLVFSREGSAYAAFVKPLTDIQLRVLRALAELGGEHVLSGEFLDLARVTSPATVKKSLVSLGKADLICSVGGEWKFVSPFFREWVRRLK